MQFQLTLLSNITILITIDHCLNMKPIISLECPGPQFWKWALNSGKVRKPLKMANFDPQKSENGCQKKKSFTESIWTRTFCKKLGPNIVKFGLSGPIYILQPAIGGHHPVPCLSTQIAERQGTAMY
jgi:hypothetical protein